MGRLKRKIFRFRRRLFQVLNQYLIYVLVGLFTIGLSFACFGMYKLSGTLVDSQARHYAQVAVKTLNEARQLYSRDVVGRVKNLESVSVAANYHEVDGGIPNPATFTIELGKSLSDEMQGMIFRLYSDYPFPYREEQGDAGPRDEFERNALVYLKQHPNDHFEKKEPLHNRQTFRYAEPVVMEASCVACHNQLPQSPKKDWQVGDVRGIVEITQPLDTVMLIAEEGLKNITLVLAAIIGLAIAGIMAVVNRLRTINQELEDKVAQRTQKLQKLATTDTLTGLANRRHFERVFSKELKHQTARHKPISLILGDVDHFKKYNDTYGHQTGDVCLHAVAQVLQAHAQEAGTLAGRFGGEEFILLLAGKTSEEAIAVADHICQDIHRLGLEHRASSAADCVTLSLGVTTTIPNSDTTQTELIKAADQALYRAKDLGRDRHVFLALE